MEPQMNADERRWLSVDYKATCQLTLHQFHLTGFLQAVNPCYRRLSAFIGGSLILRFE